MSWVQNVKTVKIKAPLKEGDAEQLRKIAGSVDSEISAYDKADYLEKVAKILEYREQRVKKASYGTVDLIDLDKVLSEIMTDADKDQIRRAFITNDAAFFARFARTTMPIIMERLDYFGFARSILKRVDIAPGQLAYFDRDVHFTLEASNLTARTANYVVTSPERIFVETFKISARISVPLEQITRLQYDILKRILQKAISMFMLSEDRIFTLLAYKASTKFNPPVAIMPSGMRPTLEALINQVRRHGIKPDKLVMHSDQFATMRAGFTSLQYDPLTAREVFMTGKIGNYEGLKVVVVPGSNISVGGIDYRTLPPGMMMVTGIPEFVGPMAVRVEPSEFPAPGFNYGASEWGWLFYEEIGMAVSNPLAIAIATTPDFYPPEYLVA